MNRFKAFLKKILPTFVIDFLRCVRWKIRQIKMTSRVRKHLPLKPKKDKLRFEINIAEHCNLNCRGCSNFSCLAEPEFVDVEEFERDFSRLGELFGNECDTILLLGGEPLLNPEIVTLIKIARKNFTKGDIVIFTNGILLPKMSGEFWQACHDNDIAIKISAYPIKIDMDAIESLSAKFGVSVQYAFDQKAGEHDTFAVFAVNTAGDGDIERNFAICVRANECITLSHGRLFTCTFAPSVRHFNKYFGQNVTITDADSVNIYDDLTGDEILRRMAQPIPACRYCDMVSMIRTMKWGISKREISEWQ